MVTRRILPQANSPTRAASLSHEVARPELRPSRAPGTANASVFDAPAASAPIALTAEGSRLSRVDAPSSRYAFTAEEVAAYHARNARTAVGKYPTMELVLRDPDAFVADVTARFTARKAVAPNDAYGFDFSEYALPVMGQVHAALDQEITKVQATTARLKRDDPWRLFESFTGKIAEHESGLSYLEELKADVGGHLARGNISYRRTQELGYFAARALGHFDLPDLSLRDRAFLSADRYLMGLYGTRLEAEIADYRAGAFRVFDGPSPVEGFKLVHDTFDTSFFGDELGMISLPTTDALGPEVFMRLASYDLFPMGITPEPQAADGFVRPGADFWAHDMRHSSSIFGRRKMYEAEHRLSEPQKRKLQKRIDVWRAELDDARKKLPDKELRYAVGFLMFNYHHDRGYPLVPSSYLPETIDRVPRLLHMMLTVSGQPVGFRKPKQTLDQAWAFLREFWLPKLAEEQAILAAEAPVE